MIYLQLDLKGWAPIYIYAVDTVIYSIDNDIRKLESAMNGNFMLNGVNKIT